jgi:chromosome segregation ATPase
MEAPTETPPDAQIKGPDSPNNDTSHLSDCNDLRAELQSQSTEETIVLLQREGDVVADLTKLVDEISRERDSLRDKVDEFEASLKDKESALAKKLDEELRKTEELKSEVEVSSERIQKLESEIKERNGLLLDLLRVSKESLKRIIESADEDEEEKAEWTSAGEEEEEEGDEEEIAETRRMAREAEEKVRECKEKRRKEKRELEKSVVSLTEENRDINSLLRAALVEKEAVEKSLSKLKGNNSNEQKRVALLQIAERGLQRVGFGFMMGTTGTTTTTSSSIGGSEQQTQTSSDTSECEEEEINVSLVCYFTVYMICHL